KDVDAANDGQTPRTPAMELARYLKPFGVQPKQLRVGDRTAKGYARADFEDAFSRYLSGLGRNVGTGQGAQGFATLGPAPGDSEVGTAESVVARGLCQRSDLDPSARTEKTENGAGRPCLTWPRPPHARPWRSALPCGCHGVGWRGRSSEQARFP